MFSICLNRYGVNAIAKRVIHCAMRKSKKDKVKIILTSVTMCTTGFVVVSASTRF